MTDHRYDSLHFESCPQTDGATMVLAFSGWMDGGDVSTGTVQRLVNLLAANEIGEIDSEPYCIYNLPGSMEVTAMFRPHITIEEGRVKSVEMPRSLFHHDPKSGLILFIGREPNLRWPTYAECLFEAARRLQVRRILFVGSFGGMVPHTRQPRLFATASDDDELATMTEYGIRPTSYSGPGSFMSYLMTEAPRAGLKMVSLIAEIPAYLHGKNPASIEAVTRRLSLILQLPLDLDSLRVATNDWEHEVSVAIEDNDELAEKVRELEEMYDDELLQKGSESGEFE